MDRRDLGSIPKTERKRLARLVREYVTQAVLDEHANWHRTNQSGGRGSGQLFLAFHRQFLNKFETYVAGRNATKLVPLPFWDPATPIPAELSDPDPQSPRTTPNPQVAVPVWLTPAGFATLRQFTDSDSLGRAMSAFHADVHNAIGGDMQDASLAPRDPIFWSWHAFLDDAWWDWQQQTVPCPDVVGRTLADASNRIRLAGLVLGKTTKRATAGTPKGRVVSQSPAGARSTPIGARVNLVVSK